MSNEGFSIIIKFRNDKWSFTFRNSGLQQSCQRIIISIKDGSGLLQGGLGTTHCTDIFLGSVVLLLCVESNTQICIPSTSIDLYFLKIIVASYVTRNQNNWFSLVSRVLHYEVKNSELYGCRWDANLSTASRFF